MKRILVLAVAALFTLSGSALAQLGSIGDPYASVNVDVAYSGPNTRGYLGDYDLFVNSITDSKLTGTDDLVGTWQESFCVDSTSLTDTSDVDYDLIDVKYVPQITNLSRVTSAPDPAAEAAAVANELKQIVAWAGDTTYAAAESFTALTQFTFDPADYSGTPAQQKAAAKAAVQSNVDTTVVAAQYAIWKTLGVGSGDLPSTSLGEKLYAKATDGSIAGANMFALYKLGTQDYAMVLLGDTQIIPEPTMLANLFALGLAGLGYAGYRRRRRK